MVSWTYKPEDFTENSYALIPEGKHRVRIERAQEKKSRTSGNEMIELTLTVSGYRGKVWSYQVLDSSSRESEKRTNQRLGAIYSSFGIQPGNLDLDRWTGRTGGAMIRHKTGPDGKERAEVSYFLYRKEVEDLPDWEERESERVPGGTVNPEMMDITERADGIPF